MIWIYVMKSSHAHSIIYVCYCLKACIRSLQTYEACSCMRWKLFSRLKLYDKFSTAHWNGLKFSFYIWGKLPRWYCHRCRRVFIVLYTNEEGKKFNILFVNFSRLILELMAIRSRRKQTFTKKSSIVIMELHST